MINPQIGRNIRVSAHISRYFYTYTHTFTNFSPHKYFHARIFTNLYNSTQKHTNLHKYARNGGEKTIIWVKTLIKGLNITIFGLFITVFHAFPTNICIFPQGNTNLHNSTRSYYTGLRDPY